MRAEGDAARERAQARANGESLPAQRQNLPDSPMYGQLNGLEQGVGQFCEGERREMQNERNEQIQSGQRECFDLFSSQNIQKDVLVSLKVF